MTSPSSSEGGETVHCHLMASIGRGLKKIHYFLSRGGNIDPSIAYSVSMVVW